MLDPYLCEFQEPNLSNVLLITTPKDFFFLFFQNYLSLKAVPFFLLAHVCQLMVSVKSFVAETTEFSNFCSKKCFSKAFLKIEKWFMFAAKIIMLVM